YNNTTHPLYLWLGLRPTPRFIHFDTVLHEFPGRRDEVRRELAAGRPRYVVSDLRAVIPTPSDNPLVRPLRLPPEFPREWAKLYPWKYRIVFRTDRYLVHEVSGPVGEIWPEGAP